MKSMFIFGASLITSLAMAQTRAYRLFGSGSRPAGRGLPRSAYFMTSNGLIAGAADTADNQSHAAVWFMGFKLDLAHARARRPEQLRLLR